MPSADWAQDTLANIESCFRQFAEGKGNSRGNPVQGVSIEGCWAAASTLHVKPVRQSAKLADDGQVLIDEMGLEHLVDKRRVTIASEVPRDLG
jgi:hypothetical protein